MSFDIVRGIISKPAQTNQLVEAVSDYINQTNDSGTLYLGYPLSASVDSKGTLENVINARIGDINTALDTINGEVI